MLEEQHPLRRQIEQELQASDWFGKFKAWGTFLETLKAQVPLTQLCQVRWITRSDELIIHCPNPEIRRAIENQAEQLAQLQGPAHQIIVRSAHVPDLVFKGENPSGECSD